MPLDFLIPVSQNHPSDKKFHRTILYWILLLVFSLSWWLSAVSLYFGNRYGVFATRAFIKGAPLFPVFFGIVLIIVRYFVLPKSGEISRRDHNVLLVSCVVLALIILGLFPFPVPALQQPGALQIISQGQRNPESQGSLIEIRQLSFLDGTPVQLEDFQLGGDWQIVGETLLSTGEGSLSLAEWSGDIPAGIVLNIRHNLDAGKFTIIWNGERTEYDLYASQSITTDLALRANSGKLLSQFTLVSLMQILFFVGLCAILYIFGLSVELNWPSQTLVRLFLGLIYALALGIFVANKLSYLEFSAIRVFRDTISYATSASAPWTSSRFWFGIRPFTYPVVLKLFGINIDNYRNSILMADTVNFQIWFSIVSWTILGLALSLKIRKFWLRPFVFAMVLMFCLNLEVSLWDSLLLTESVSLSLFALLMTGWLIWDLPATQAQPRLLETGKLLLLIVVTVLYIFTRESNQYFVIFAAVLFPLFSLMGKLGRDRLKQYLGYLFIFILIVVLKNVAFNVSNDWKIHIYDHLALRILHDPDAQEFFAEAGLPVDQNLLQITEMAGFEYQEYLANDPEMGAVREWIDQSAVTTYLKYLLSQPFVSLLEPFRQLPSLLGGDNLEYHSPLNGVPTIPQRLIELTHRIYPRVSIIMWTFVGVSVLGVIWYLFSGMQQSAWLVVGVLLVSLYPLLFIVWHGNPMEIERHAAQIGVQYRLMGWVAIALLLDHLALGEIHELVSKAQR
jgi:hypothetical protein